MFICNFRGFFPWMKPWHPRVEIWWSSLLNQKCTEKERLSGWTTWSPHWTGRADPCTASSPSLPSRLCLQPPSSVWAFLGTDRGQCAFEQPWYWRWEEVWGSLLGSGTRQKQRSFPRNLMLRVLVGVVRRSMFAMVMGRAMTNDGGQGGQGGGSEWARAEESTLETDWVGGLGCCSEKVILNPKGNGVPLEALGGDPQTEWSRTLKSVDQRWCECEVSVWTQDAIKNDWAGLSAYKDLGRRGRDGCL